MRKVILTLLFSGIGLYAMGQSTMVPINGMTPMKVTGMPRGSKGSQPVGKTNTSTPISQWYDLIDEAANNGEENYSTGAAHIFSDSTVKVLYVESQGAAPTLGYCTLQDVGEVFDPQFDGYNNPVSLYTTYSIDSVALPYLYHYVPEKDSLSPDGLVHDTLIFQFYTLKTGGIDTFAFGTTAAPGEPYVEIRYNWPTNLGLATTGMTYKYILGAKDSESEVSAGGTLPAIVVPVNNSNGTNGIAVNDVTNKKLGFNRDLFAYTVSYRPGFKWKIGDTIDEQYTATPIAHPHSHFRIFQGENLAKDMPANTYEMSLKISSIAIETNPITHITDTVYGGQRYGKDVNGWPGLYVPGTAWNAFDEALYTEFYLNSPNDAAINYNVGDPNGYILGNVYPNPANGNANLDFALGNTEQVKITMYDMLGHEVATLANGQYTSGTHTISFNTDNLKEGIYMYSINAGSFAKTLKFTVVHN